MTLSKRQIRQLENIIASAQAVLASAGSATGSKGRVAARPKRVRRSGKELIAFRKTLRAERRKGIPVADIARKHNVSPAYIYQL